MKKVEITEEGLQKLQSELEFLNNVALPETQEKVQAARALGDLSENADYSANMDRLQEINNRIGEIMSVLSNYTIIRERSIMIEYLTDRGGSTGEIERINLVGPEEIDPVNNKISRNSPLGKAIALAKKGDTITVKSDSQNEFKVKILSAFDSE